LEKLANGRDVTTIKSPSTSDDVIVLNNLTAVAISDISIVGGYRGIHNVGSSPIISGNKITENMAGIANGSCAPIISGNGGGIHVVLLRI